MVVAVVLLAAIVVPNLSTDRVAGQPVARKLSGPPSVGACVTRMADPWRIFDEPGSGTSSVTVLDDIDYPSAEYGRCDGPIVGEVVSVDESARPPARISVTNYQTGISPCAIDAISYTGSIPPVVERAQGQPGIVWAPQQNFEYTTVGPDRAQRVAGQAWSACIIGPNDGQDYIGHLEHVLTDGWLPPAFGACLTSAVAGRLDRPDRGRAGALRPAAPHRAPGLDNSWAAVGQRHRSAAGVPGLRRARAADRRPDPTRRDHGGDRHPLPGIGGPHGLGSAAGHLRRLPRHRSARAELQPQPGRYRQSSAPDRLTEAHITQGAVSGRGRAL